MLVRVRKYHIRDSVLSALAFCISHVLSASMTLSAMCSLARYTSKLRAWGMFGRHGAFTLCGRLFFCRISSGFAIVQIYHPLSSMMDSKVGLASGFFNSF